MKLDKTAAAIVKSASVLTGSLTKHEILQLDGGSIVERYTVLLGGVLIEFGKFVPKGVKLADVPIPEWTKNINVRSLPLCIIINPVFKAGSGRTGKAYLQADFASIEAVEL